MTVSELSVLVVEDDQSNYELVEAAFDGTGLRLIPAATAAAARAWLANNVPWLILMDIDLPDGDGLDLTRELRADSRLAAVRVMALTANATSGFENEVIAAGCDEYLTKPLQLSQLLARVQTQASKVRTAKPPVAGYDSVRVTARARVLVVDDEAVNRALMRAILEPAGFEVGTANGAAEALVALHQQVPDVVLLDVMMPDIDGFALCRAIRRVRATKLLPIVMVSALDGVDYRIESLHAGADDYIAKPVVPAEVIARVESLVLLSQAHRDARGDRGLLSRLSEAKGDVDLP